ncbi:hypothetical protein BHE74_00014478 [Ensete ventricosum]|nr:hypothetical protein BHE74_00014478 [Ensete ventricosum]
MANYHTTKTTPTDPWNLRSKENEGSLSPRSKANHHREQKKKGRAGDAGGGPAADRSPSPSFRYISSITSAGKEKVSYMSPITRINILMHSIYADGISLYAGRRHTPSEVRRRLEEMCGSRPRNFREP